MKVLKYFSLLPAFTFSVMQVAPASSEAPKKSMADYYLPMPPVAPLVSEGIWGAQNVLPRDVKNGLEHHDYCYWDGKIVKSDDGRYHLYCSRWDQSYNHHTPSIPGRWATW